MMSFRDVRGEQVEKPSDASVRERTASFGVAVDAGTVFCVVEAWCDGLYGFPGGRVEAGESLREALRREFREETGRDVEVVEELRSFGWKFYSEEKGRFFDSTHVFFAVRVGEHFTKVTADDVRDTGWFDARSVTDETMRYPHWKVLESVSEC